MIRIRTGRVPRLVAGALVTGVLLVVGGACSQQEAAQQEAAHQEVAVTDQSPTGSAVPAGAAPGVVLASEIPVAHTPPGGWTGTMPPPVLATCTEPLSAGAPDLRGVWKAVSVEVAGRPVSDHPALSHVERVEQCGDRLVVTAGGIIHDMRCDGTEANGVHDVAEMDHRTPITVVATYEDGVHVLRPVGLPGVEVTRRLDGDQMVWTYLGFTARLERVGPPDADPASL